MLNNMDVDMEYFASTQGNYPTCDTSHTLLFDLSKRRGKDFYRGVLADQTSPGVMNMRPLASLDNDLLPVAGTYIMFIILVTIIIVHYGNSVWPSISNVVLRIRSGSSLALLMARPLLLYYSLTFEKT